MSGKPDDEEDMARWSDGQLHDLRRDFHNHVELEDTKQDKIMTAVAELSDKVNMVELKQDQLIKETKDMIDAWKAGSVLGRFVQWLGGFAIVGVIIAWVAEHYKP